MARYYFHLRYGRPATRLAIDPEGDEIPDGTLVRDHALEVARKVSRTRAHAVHDWMDCTFEITDERGCAVMTVPFSDGVPSLALPDAPER